MNQDKFKLKFFLQVHDIFFIITQGDTGSPVTKVMEENGVLTHYIIGIVLSTVVNDSDAALRIKRISAALKDIEKMIKVLQSSEEGRIECYSSSDEDFTNKLNKRNKIE